MSRHFLNKEFWKNSILVLTSLTLSLYLIEYIAFSYSIDRHTVAYQNNVNFDKRSRFEVIRDSKMSNLDLVPYFSPYYLMKENTNINAIFPLSGLANSETIYCNESGQYSYYLSDRYGFNNSNDIYDKKIDLVLIGDSFVHGACVDNKDHIAGHLIKDGKSVLNLGAGGTGPVIQNAIFREYGNIGGANVVWFFFEGNDMENIISEQKIPFLSKYIDSETSNSLKEKQQTLDKMNKQFIFEKYNLAKKKKIIIQPKKSELVKFATLYSLRSLVKRFLSKKKSKGIKDYNKEIDTFVSILEKVKQTVEKDRGHLYFVYLPSFSRVFGLDLEFSQKDKLITKIREKNIEVIDVYNDVFENYKDKEKLFYFGLNGHYTPLGYKLLSQKLIDVLNARKY